MKRLLFPLFALICLMVVAQPSQSQQAKGKKGKPDLYVLAAQIDIDVLKAGGVPNSREAELLEKLLKERSTKFYDEVHTKVLKGKEASRDNILAGLAWLVKNMNKRDVAVVFLAGHGEYHAATKQYKYFPVSGPIEGMELRAAFAKLPGQSILFLQTCNAHGILMTPMGEKPFRNTQVVCACDDDQKADRLMGMVMVRGLAGLAADAADKVTTNSLAEFLGQKVGAVTKGKQNIRVSKPPGFTDFPLAVKGALDFLK